MKSKTVNFFESILNKPATNVKQVIIAKGIMSSYNRKSKMNEKAKALVE